MSNLTQNLYKIDDLYIVKFKDNWEYDVNNQELNSHEFPFCLDTFYIIEREKIKDEFKYNEYYEECITGIDFYSRSEYKDFNDVPPIFISIETIPLEYFTEEELASHLVSSSRLFVIFQLLNFKELTKEKEKPKVLKYGEKVC